MHKLTPEQEFAIVSFETQIQKMSKEQAIQTLGILYKSYVTQRSMFLEMLKQAWFSGDVNS